MKKVRIAAGAGFAGDRIEPALDIVNRADADYIIFECLAERTIALANQKMLKNPDRGYNPFLKQRFQKILPLLKNKPVKIVTNMGAANPLKAAEVVSELARSFGISSLKVAAVTGDNVMSHIPPHMNQKMFETNEPLTEIAERIISANAYIGAKPIGEALRLGADIVITGRVADASLAVGPLMHEYGKSYEDYDFLGRCTLAGHLMECAGQLSGGYFADPGLKDVPELWNLGFPILSFCENGEMTIEKLPGTGGVINKMTVKEQLLYEVQNPKEYLTPDVVADFSETVIDEIGENRVLVYGAKGVEPTGSYKVSVGYKDGFIGEGEISYGGQGAKARAELAGKIIKERLKKMDYQCKDIRFDLMGVNSLYRDNPHTQPEPTEVRLRVAARVETEKLAQIVGNEVEALYTNGPYGGGGARGYVREVVAVGSIFIPATDVETSVVIYTF